ncbi:uncharacterized protein TNCV_1246841 [Trichonephila clavipes]|uniref:Uncharacterized protein n=1 Tax=Trichonephila clavipes TaxID=2585209 RepID=A0A8X6RFH3_TRICX|nr:uncharacterized protein TNCV_1246841 [Trichonephila clavipes]
MVKQRRMTIIKLNHLIILTNCELPNPSSTVLTYLEIPSFQSNKMNLTWRNPPAHHWYGAKSSVLSIQCRSYRVHQTDLASFSLLSMTFVQGVKSSFTCPCSLLASPAHLLDCWGISLRQLYEQQDLVCTTITRKGIMTYGNECLNNISRGIVKEKKERGMKVRRNKRKVEERLNEELTSSL